MYGQLQEGPSKSDAQGDSSPESDPASNTGTVSALLQSQHAGTVPMYGQLQEGPSKSDAQGDSSPVPASRQQENRPRVLSHREQLSKAGSHAKVADALESEGRSSENKKSETLENKKSEIRNKKSEAQRVVSAAVAEPTQQERTIVAPENEEEWPVVGDQWSETQQAEIGAVEMESSADIGSSCRPCDNSDPVSACSDSQLPPFVGILQRVMERSRESDDGSLTFTFDEMEFLAADPLFARFEPVIAADIRKVLAESSPGD